jgi:hypothetical protein
MKSSEKRAPFLSGVRKLLFFHSLFSWAEALLDNDNPSFIRKKPLRPTICKLLA